MDPLISALLQLKGQVAWGSIAVWLIQRIKESPRFAFINPYTDALNRFASILMAALGTVGITATLADGTLTVTGLDLASVGTFLINLLFQFFFQQGVYHGIVKTAKKTDVAVIQPDNLAPPTDYI